MSRKKIGELLVDSGVVTPEQLEEALADQKALGGRIGTILFEKCALSERDYLLAVSSHLGIPAIDFTKFTIPERVIKMLSKDDAWRYMALPVRLDEDDRLVVAMADPTDLANVDAISGLMGKRVRPALALEISIRQVLLDYYDNHFGTGDYRLKEEVRPVDCVDVTRSVYKTSDEKAQEDPYMDGPFDYKGGEEKEAGDCDCDQAVLELEQRLVKEYSNFSTILRALLRELFQKGVLTPDEFTRTLNGLKGDNTE